MPRPILALLLLGALAFAMAVPYAAGAGPLLLSVTGPPALAPGQTAAYNVTGSGGPTGNVTYTVTYFISGSNVTGGNPVAASPGKTTGNRTAYKVNITAPAGEQDLLLTVTLSAAPKGGTPEAVTITYPITVIKPIELSATFHNASTVAAVNVTVRWLIDGALVGTSSIKRIAANGDATASFRYLPVGLAAGQHTLQVEADLDHDGIIDPAKGEVVTSTLFYTQVQEPSTGWTVLFGIGIFVPVFLGVVALRRRGQR